MMKISTPRHFFFTNEEIARHPKGKITLVDGTELTCHAVVSREGLTAEAGGLRVDTDVAQGGRERSTDWDAVARLFRENAFFLFAHRERILNDSRMFLAPVRFPNNLMLTGAQNMEFPTLGVYIEWWKHHADTLVADDEGYPARVYCLCGSPLSGQNHSAAVRADGTRVTVELTPFIDRWKPFTQINTRYRAAKWLYEAYTLRQVVDRLRHEPVIPPKPAAPVAPDDSAGPIAQIGDHLFF